MTAALRLAGRVLGSGVLVLPLLAAERGRGVTIAVTVTGVVAIAASAWVFTARPFGKPGRSSVTATPVPPRLLYIVGISGGTAYFWSGAAALGSAITGWRHPVAVAAVACLIGLRLAVPAPEQVAGWLPTARSYLAVLVAFLAPLSPSVWTAMGRDSGRGVAVGALCLASLMLAVGWESLPRLRPAPRTLVAAVGICAGCVAVVMVHAAAGVPQARWPSASVRAQVVGWAVVALLVSFAAGNLRTITGLWRTLPAVRSGAAATAYAAGGVLVVAAVLLAAGWARAWVLLLPGAATCLLYAGFALGLWSRRKVRGSVAVSA